MNTSDKKLIKEITKEILELKLKRPKTQGTKLKIQKLQQKLEEVEGRINSK